MSGTITQLQRDRGVGTLLGEDRKSYPFRRTDVRACGSRPNGRSDSCVTPHGLVPISKGFNAWRDSVK